ncbi:MAG: hypothetical protein GY771_09185 [bacterium]|nr:hypothetical protein [bacterium]
MIRFVAENPPIPRALAASVISDLLTMAGVAPDAELVIYYGDISEIPPEADIAIPPVKGPVADEIVARFDLEGVSVPVVYPGLKEPGDELIRRDGDTLVFGFDVVRAAAELIVEQSEFRKLGDFGRPDIEAEPAFRRELLSAPTVNLYARLLRRGLRERRPDILRPLWPGDAPYAVLLSHDVDRIASGSRLRRLRDALGALRRGERIHNLDFLSAAHRYDSIAAMMEMERRYGATSTFFFSAINRGEIDPDYGAADVADLITKVNAAGCEVALHPSFYCPDADGLREEIASLEKAGGVTVAGIRGHYLQPEPPECFDRSEPVGSLYDATPGFPSVTAFRYGVAGQFTAYNTNEERPYDLVTIPMMCMDGTLYGYLQMNRKRARARIFELMDTVKASGGAFSLLWHSDTFPGGSKPKWGWVYEETLRKAKADGAAFMTHKECAEWYKGRRVEMEVIEGL